MLMSKIIKSGDVLCNLGVYHCSHQTARTGHQSVARHTHSHTRDKLDSPIRLWYNFLTVWGKTCVEHVNIMLTTAHSNNGAGVREGWKIIMKSQMNIIVLKMRIQICVFMRLCWHGGYSATVQRLHWKTVYKSVWVWTVQTVIGLLHTERNPLKGQLYPPDISTFKQANSRSLDQGCEQQLSHPSPWAPTLLL